MIALTLTIGSCTAFETHSNNQYKLATLECEETK
jgi:hypothetical protein